MGLRAFTAVRHDPLARAYYERGGKVWQVRPLTEEQKALFQALKVDRPPHYYLKLVTHTRKTA